MTTSQTRKSKKFTAEKIAAYSAMAGAFLLLNNEAAAEIIYVDVPDETIDIGELLAVDMDGDGVLDLIFQATSTTGGSWSFARVFGSVTSYTVGGPSNAFIGYSGPYLPYGSALNSGDPIGAAADFMYNSGNQVFLASIYAGVTYGQFADVTDKYLGIEFTISGELHYGWLRLDGTVGPVSITLKDWAYESIPDEPIAAGELAPPPAEISFSTPAITIDESAGTATVTIEINESADVSVDVDLNAGLTTATAGSDFTFVDPSPVMFTAGGATTQSFTVDISDDLIDEPDETIVLDLSSPVGGVIVSPDEFTITINDNDGAPGISYSVASTSVVEDETTITGTVHVDVASDCSVDVSINPGLTTATNGDDFDFSSPLTLNFTAGGATSLDFNVDINDDVIVEPDETITLDLGSVTGGCVLEAPDQFTITITNEDMLPTASVSIEEQHVTYNEDDGTVAGTVLLSESTDCNVDVILEATGDATEGEDFTFSSPQSVNFTVGGTTSADFDIPIIDDAVSESTEIINFSLQNATGSCTIDGAASTMMLHIIDNDAIGISGQDGAAAIIYSYDDAIAIQLLYAGWQKASMNLFDQSGKKVFFADLVSADNKFTLSDIPDGVYVVQLIVDGKSIEKNIYLGRN